MLLDLPEPQDSFDKKLLHDIRPGNLIMGALSIGISAKLVMKYGYRKPLAAGLLLAAVGLGLLARAPVHGHFLQNVLPSMILLGLGAGIAFNPVLLAAMGDVEPQEAGIASGIVNTSFMMGGALGFAVLASIASSRTSSLQTAGHSASAALTGGYHAAFLGGTICAVLAAVVGVALLHEAKAQGFADGEKLGAEPVFDVD